MIAAFSGGVLMGADVTLDMDAYVADRIDTGKPSEVPPYQHNTANGRNGGAIDIWPTAIKHYPATPIMRSKVALGSA